MRATAQRARRFGAVLAIMVGLVLGADVAASFAAGPATYGAGWSGTLAFTNSPPAAGSVTGPAASLNYGTAIRVNAYCGAGFAGQTGYTAASNTLNGDGTRTVVLGAWSAAPSCTVTRYDLQETSNFNVLKTINATDATYPDSTAPTAPTTIAAAKSGSDVTVTWSGATDDVGVTGYRLAVDGGAWVTGVTSPYVNTGGAGAGHSYAVQARDAAGNWSTSATAAFVYVSPDVLTGASDSVWVQLGAAMHHPIMWGVFGLAAVVLAMGLVLKWVRKAVHA